MASIAHTADTHLGYKQYHRQERIADFSLAFQQVIDDAIDNNLDAVVHAGDFFHDSRPNTTAILNAIQQLRRLKNNNIPFLLVVGNHEDTHESQWADIFEEMGLATRLGKDPVVIGDTAFYGLDYIPPTRRAALDYEFTPHDATYAALVAHGGFKPLAIYDDWNAEHVLGRSNIQFDAFLLGDDHTPKTEHINDTLASYPGSTERTSHDQREDRVYNRVTFGGFSGGVEIEQEPLDTRTFTYIDKRDLTPEDTSRLVRDAIDNSTTQDAIVIITLDGEGEPYNMADLEEYTLDQGALVARARDARSLQSNHVDVDVSFADPDEAVDSRIREKTLSSVGHELDHTVRDLGGIPETNMADTIKERIDEKLDSDPDAFTTTVEQPDTDTEAGSDDNSGTQDSVENSGSAQSNENKPDINPVELTDEEQEAIDAMEDFDDFTDEDADLTTEESLEPPEKRTNNTDDTDETSTDFPTDTDGGVPITDDDTEPTNDSDDSARPNNNTNAKLTDF